MPSALGTSVAAYLCGIMLVLGIIIAIGLFRQKAGKKSKSSSLKRMRLPK